MQHLAKADLKLSTLEGFNGEEKLCKCCRKDVYSRALHFHLYQAS
jgi:hypothetical protein